MGNDLVGNDIEPGKLYMKDVATGVITEVKIEQENPLPLTEGINSFELTGTVSIKTEVKTETWRKILGYISRKRFRKLLQSIGYQRNEIEEIIKVEWICKRHYTIHDFYYWEKHKKGEVIWKK